MIFKLDKKLLADSVNIVSKAVVQGRTVQTALLNLLMVFNKGHLRITGTDQEIMMIANIEAEAEQDGHFAIPAKLFQEVIASMPESEDNIVTFELEEQDSREVILSCARSRYRLQLQNDEGFPPVPVFGDEINNAFEINSQILKQGLKEAGIAVNTEDTNPVQNGVCIDFAAEPPTMVSTDARRLAVTALKELKVPEELKKTYIVPARAITELSKLLDENETVKICLYNQQLVVLSEQFQLIIRLINGSFPDYSRVLPKESSRTLTLDRKDFLKALKAVTPISRVGGDVVFFEISQNETRVWAQAQDMGSAEAFLSTELTGEPINIAFNLSFVADFLNSIEDKTVIIEMTAPNYPGLLKSGNPESDYKYVLMPMATAY